MGLCALRVSVVPYRRVKGMETHTAKTQGKRGYFPGRKLPASSCDQATASLRIRPGYSKASSVCLSKKWAWLMSTIKRMFRPTWGMIWVSTRATMECLPVVK